MSKIVLRTYNPDIDKSYVYSTWLKCYKHESDFGKKIHPSQFFYWHQKVIDRILDQPDSVISVACLSDNEDVIVGYLVYQDQSKPVLHFCYIKPSFRLMGIAKQLFKDNNINIEDSFFTHWTFPINKILPKFQNMIYDPYLI